VWISNKIFIKKIIFNNLQKIDKKFKNIDSIHFSGHHLSHAASAFFCSPFEESAVLVLDAVGEWNTSTIFLGKGNSLKLVNELNFPDSLGMLYSAFTYFLGFKINEGEYKMMGLAPYGENKYKKLILENLIDLKEDGSFALNMKYFDFETGLTMTNQKFSSLFGISRRNESDPILQKHMDLARSIQEITEEIILKIASYIKQKFNQKNLCLAGGVALNCVANGKLLKKKIFENIWVQPAAGDAGGSLGAALAYNYIEKKNKREINKNKKISIFDPYIGPDFDYLEIKRDLNKVKANYKEIKYNELIKFISKEISNGKVVSWFNDKLEFGPRALGNRSILADPRNNKMQSILNQKIKFREGFRPFAPIILEEELTNWFDIDTPSPYMLFTAIAKKKLNSEYLSAEQGFNKLNVIKSDVPAVTHVDYSSRIQTVNARTNKKMYDLLNQFFKDSGVPMLINTSFNIKDEPMVCNIEDAYKTFLISELDYLVCGNFLLDRNQF
jgi:carbamoyltransferase